MLTLKESQQRQGETNFMVPGRKMVYLLARTVSKSCSWRPLFFHNDSASTSGQKVAFTTHNKFSVIVSN